MKKEPLMYHIILCLCLFFTASLSAMTPDEVIQKITAQRNLIKDWSAIYTQETSGGLLGKGDVEMGRITVKGDNVRKDIQRPVRRIRIQTPMLVIEKDEVTGDLTTTDLSQKSGVMGLPKMTPEEALQRVSFQVVSEDESEIVLEGFLESLRMTMTVDARRFVLKMMTMSLSSGAEMVMTQTYADVSEIPMLIGSETTMTMMMGSRRETMGVRVSYRHVKVNQGVNDDFFRL
jgi:outer membrane lipoprotein-sorting protein